ncbi:MAG TPA: MFS transporter [Actinomycetota bacterium]|nr:MFS transporter [Actinomycetota bacterium]
MRIITDRPRSAVRRLALARLISITGGAAAFAALNFTIYERTGSAAWLSASLLLTFGASGLFAPLGGMLGDRFDRQRVMIASDLAGAAAFAAMAFVEDPALLLAIGFVTAVVETPFWSASQAAIPNLVSKDELPWANGLLQLGANAGIMLGPAVGGVLLAVIGAGMVFGLNALSFVLSALVVATVRGRFSEDRSEHEDEHRGIKAGFVFIAHDRILRILVIAWTVFVFGIGMVMVADVPLVEEFGSGATGYGLLIGCWGAGSVLGSLAGRKLNERIEPKALFVGTAVIGVTTAGVALSPWFPPVLVLILLAGAADAVVMVADRSIQQRRTPDVVRSRVVSASESMITIALAFGFVLGGPALELLGPRGVYAAGGAFAFVGAVVLLPILRASRRTTEQPELALDEVVEAPELVAAGVTR